MVFLWCRLLGVPTLLPVSYIPHLELGLQFGDGSRPHSNKCCSLVLQMKLPYGMDPT